MRIQELNVQNFRSLKDVVWKPTDLNVLIGPNASGKTNLLRLLEFLKAAAAGTLVRYVQREGGMEPLVWDGTANSLSLELHTTPLEGGRNGLQYSLELVRIGNSGAFIVERESLVDVIGVQSGRFDKPFRMLDRQRTNAVVFDTDQRRLSAPPESVEEGETLLSMAAGPFAANPQLTSYQQHLARLAVYRDVSTASDSPMRKPSVASMDRRLESNGSNFISVLHTLYTTDREFRRNLRDAMTAAFGSEFEDIVFPPAADQQIQMRIQWRSLKREQTAADVSDGTLRFLFLLTALANPEPPAIMAIDEPETGLHPSMLPIIADFALEACKRTQIIFTTHSPDFLDAFGGKLKSATVVSWPQGRTTLETKTGQELEYWLERYSLGELYRSGQLEH
ncbi:MAG: AAA family ATPase [Bryobacteraceae bacterium]|nr:AAA family ATPase [Bryobacteraceae bacterium]